MSQFFRAKCFTGKKGPTSGIGVCFRPLKLVSQDADDESDADAAFVKITAFNEWVLLADESDEPEAASSSVASAEAASSRTAASLAFRSGKASQASLRRTRFP